VIATLKTCSLKAIYRKYIRKAPREDEKRKRGREGSPAAPIAKSVCLAAA